MPVSADLPDPVLCPDCGYRYPPGTVVLNGTVLDPIVESGGRSGHPSTCDRSEAPSRLGAQGVFQQRPAFTTDRAATGRRRKR